MPILSRTFTTRPPGNGIVPERSFKGPVLGVGIVALVAMLALMAIVAQDADSIRASATPAWETYAQHEALARYWLDDDYGPTGAAPQEEVDEQEHVY